MQCQSDEAKWQSGMWLLRSYSIAPSLREERKESEERKRSERSEGLMLPAALRKLCKVAAASPLFGYSALPNRTASSLFSFAEPLLRFGFGGADADASAFRLCQTASPLLRFSARFGEAFALAKPPLR
uniref:Uncharacterized protein n=1 Tax=Hydrodictyon reticulatum TaxID=3107 RepID=A0A1W5RN07_HYDRE|nr:hypothetical protein [Hydrodictyon reticulatum]AQU64580.1 hypothetical protein [Hydrodictyon reticulatum]